METTANRYSLQEFLDNTAQRDRGQGFFELESPRMLEVNLDNQMVWTKTGSMVAYRGSVKFSRESLADQGLGRIFKKALTGEGTRLTKAEGQGSVYLADTGKKVTILNLQGDSIVVNGNDILAFEDSIIWDIRLMKLSAMLAGGLTNVILEGSGMAAITTHYEPMTLRVAPGSPVITDPNATVAWSASLNPSIKTDISIGTFLGRGSGESIQLKFEGEGFVVVQPYEEIYYAQVQGG